MPIGETTVVPVSVGGFTWSAFFGLLLTIINGTAVGIWLRTRPRMAEIHNQRDESEAARLAARVDTLEKMVDRLHAKIDQERAEHDALMSIMRHRVTNSRATLKAIVMMLRVNPDKVGEALTQIEAMIFEQETAERDERAAFDRARMAVAALKETQT